MKTRTLQFEKLSDLEMFLGMIDKKPCIINTRLQQITGALPEKDVEFAKSAFAAMIVDTFIQTKGKEET